MTKKIAAAPTPLPQGVHITDTHTHLYLEDFSDNNSLTGNFEAVQRAIDAGVNRMIFPNVNIGTIEPMKAVAEAFRDNIRMAMGLHPTEIVPERLNQDLTTIYDELKTGKYIAVGEVGIDLYWDKTFEKEQMEILETQINWAKELDLPVILHCREGLDQVLEVIQQQKDLTYVFHSFTGTQDDVTRILSDFNAFFGINGIVSFKNNTIRDALPAIGKERMLLETDSPYLAPVPYRGRRNESAYIIATANSIAESLNTDTASVAEATAQNSIRVFGF